MAWHCQRNLIKVTSAGKKSEWVCVCGEITSFSADVTSYFFSRVESRLSRIHLGKKVLSAIYRDKKNCVSMYGIERPTKKRTHISDFDTHSLTLWTLSCDVNVERSGHKRDKSLDFATVIRQSGVCVYLLLCGNFAKSTQATQETLHEKRRMKD